MPLPAAGPILTAAARAMPWILTGLGLIDDLKPSKGYRHRTRVLNPSVAAAGKTLVKGGRAVGRLGQHGINAYFTYAMLKDMLGGGPEAPMEPDPADEIQEELRKRMTASVPHYERRM